jgi:hypothetical protein
LDAKSVNIAALSSAFCAPLSKLRVWASPHFATDALAVSVTPSPLLTRFPVEILTIELLASRLELLIESIAKFALEFVLIDIIFSPFPLLFPFNFFCFNPACRFINSYPSSRAYASSKNASPYASPAYAAKGLFFSRFRSRPEPLTFWLIFYCFHIDTSKTYSIFMKCPF